MGITLQQISQRPVVVDLYSTLKTPPALLSDFFGFMSIGGQPAANTMPIGGRTFWYDIMDRARSIATVRAPGTPAATAKLSAVGFKTGVFPRVFQQLPVPYEKIFRGRPLGGDWAELDVFGERYILAQMENFRQTFINFREFLVSRMLRGSFQVARSGDDWIPVDSGGSMTVDYQVPAGNKSQLNMLGVGNIIGTPWDNPAASIFGNCNGINAAFEQLHGFPLRHCWITSSMWANVISNTEIKSLGGTSNTPFAAYDVVAGNGPDGRPINAFTAILRALPWLQWHIYDGGLEVNGMFTKTIAEDKCIFLPEPDRQWAEMLEGSEPQMERDGAEPFEAVGMQFWSNNFANPPQLMLYGCDNALPALKIPTAVAYGTVIGF